jgi:hypothetical protein
LSSSGGRSAAVAIDFAPKRYREPCLLGEHRHFHPHAPIEWCLTSTTPPHAVGPHRRRHCSLESRRRRASHRLHVDGLLGRVSELLTLPNALSILRSSHSRRWPRHRVCAARGDRARAAPVDWATQAVLPARPWAKSGSCIVSPFFHFLF